MQGRTHVCTRFPTDPVYVYKPTSGNVGVPLAGTRVSNNECLGLIRNRRLTDPNHS
ncbi:hypothetical protein QNI22_35845 [Cytophagaceae bacterium BD1B2-1]|uniref:Uncharacterized protein n=1 Tax=Xanthocytophaga agilis TaxID=3048010 RepID=A0AAE3UK19_9BACT|nr:hypothetical protein [Xanthocytophaga agilis]